MKYIFDHMFEGIIISVVVLGLILIINNTSFTSSTGTTSTGFLNILGNQVKEQSTKNEITDNATVLTNILSQEKPKIFYKTDGLANINSIESINILNYFKIKFSGDENLYTASSLSNENISILDITNSQGNSILSSYNTQNKTIIFSSPGIFTIKLCVSDSENRTTIANIKIPVNG